MLTEEGSRRAARRRKLLEMKPIKKHPKTLDEAIKMVLTNIDAADTEHIIKHGDNGLHFGLGMYLRNNMGLWLADTPFKKDVKKRFKLFGHGDDCSGLILAGVVATLRKQDIAAKLKREAAGYRKHWEKQGIDPLTGKKN